MGRLPSELLAEVFYWYISTVYRDSRKSPATGPSPYAWLILGHVCRAWRGVLLGYPKFYTFIPWAEPQCVEMMIRCARDLPLQIHEQPTPRMTSPSVQLEIGKLVLTNILRCTTADLAVNPGVVDPGLMQQHGTSQLRELNVQLWNSAIPHVDLDSPIFPNMKFPHLHSLNCAFGSLAAVSNMLHSGLRRLDLSRPGRVSCDQLLAAIAPLQALEELHLRDASIELEAEGLPTVPEQLISPPQHAIVLAQLRHLQISDYWSDSGIYILHHIVYPASASVRVHLRCPQPHMFDFIHSVVVAKLCGQGVIGLPPEPQSISLLAGFDIKLHLTLWERRQTLTGIEEKRYAAEDAYFQLSVSFVMDEGAVGALVRQLPLAGVRTAMLAEQVVDSEPLARTALVAGLPLLEELQLEYESFDGAAGAPPAAAELRGPSGAPLDDEDPASVFPQLKVLRVHELHHAQALQLAAHASELAHLARWLGAMCVKDKSPFASLSTYNKQSEFSTVPLCCCSCSGSHTMGTFASFTPLPISDLVPCCCLPCFYLLSGIGRVISLFSRRRN